MQLEFQPTVDPITAVRLLARTGLLYQDLRHHGEAPPGGALPPALYNDRRLRGLHRLVGDTDRGGRFCFYADDSRASSVSTKRRKCGSLLFSSSGSILLSRSNECLPLW